MNMLATGLAVIAAAVPGTIAVEDGNKPFLIGHAVGVQIYTCNGSTWGPATPRANVYGDNGKLLMTHFAGPSWQARDGSRTMASRVDGVTVDPTAIPWLLLSAAPPAAGADAGQLAGTTFIQRTATTGGLAPAAAGASPPVVATRWM